MIPRAQGEPRGNWTPDQVRNDGNSICGVVRSGPWIDLFAEDETNSVAHVVIKPDKSAIAKVFRQYGYDIKEDRFLEACVKEVPG